MSFFNPPARPLPLEQHRSYQSAAMNTKVGYNIYWEIPGIRHDLPRLSAWLGSDGLQFAARHFAASGAKDAPTSARAAETDELAPAAECRARGGLPNFFAFGNRLSELWQANRPGESSGMNATAASTAPAGAGNLRPTR